MMVLSGCGGGGSSSSVPSNQATYDFAAALKTLVIAGQNISFSISNSNGCQGTGTYVVGPVSAGASFEGSGALSSVSVISGQFSNCTPASFSETATNFYSPVSYQPIGYRAPQSYVTYANSTMIPSSIKVGDVGLIGLTSRYSDSSKSILTGTQELSYTVEADSATSAMVTLHIKTYNTSKTLESTQLTKYKIDTANTMTLVSMTVQMASGVNTVYTRR